MAQPLQDTQDPGVAFYMSMVRPLREKDLEIEDFVPQPFGNDPLDVFFDDAAQYPYHASDIRNVVASLI